MQTYLDLMLTVGQALGSARYHESQTEGALQADLDTLVDELATLLHLMQVRPNDPSDALVQAALVEATALRTQLATTATPLAVSLRYPALTELRRDLYT